MPQAVPSELLGLGLFVHNIAVDDTAHKLYGSLGHLKFFAFIVAMDSPHAVHAQAYRNTSLDAVFLIDVVNLLECFSNIHGKAYDTIFLHVVCAAAEQDFSFLTKSDIPI